MKKLIQETHWSRIYLDSNGMRVYESKLETEASSLNCALARNEWPKWTSGERLDFAKALSAKSKLNAEDELVLRYLIGVCDDMVASTIASSVARISDAQGAVRLLLNRMDLCEEPRANFYKALAKFGDQRAVRGLEGEHGRLKQHLADSQQNPKDIYIVLDYIACCAALHETTSDARYGAMVSEYVDDPNLVVRDFARSLLDAGLQPRR
jgi:hypothetical protein